MKNTRNYCTRNYWKRWTLAGVSLTAALLASNEQPVRGDGNGMIPQPGAMFPNIALPSTDATAISISELRGNKLVLHVFASW